MHDWRAFVRQKLPPLSIGPAREAEIVAELALQAEQAYSDAIADGAAEPEAIGRAQAQFADWQALARAIESAEVPSGARGGIFSGIGQDLRYAARYLKRSPAFAIIAVCTLAFGIGGNTAIFTMVDAVALRGLPFREPSRLMAIETRKARQPELESWTSAADFFDIRERTRAFARVAATSAIWNLVMTGRGEPERLECLFVSADFFPALGVDAAVGRTFSPQEDDRTRPTQVVVLSHAFWQRRFGGSPDVVGQSIALDNFSGTIIGVLPAGFRYPGEPLAGTTADVDVWLPLATNQLVASARSVRYLKVIGRLRPGVSVIQARDDLRSIGAALAAQYPEWNAGFEMDAQPLAAQVSGRFRVAMMLLLGTVGFVLLMACANVANLLLTRATARQRELAVRAALGASRLRIVRQLLTEGIVLAACGGLAGLALAAAGVKFLARTAPGNLIRPGDVSLDLRALLFTTAAVLVSALLSGLPPAWRLVRADIESSLRESGRSLAGGHHRLRAALVVIQVTAALLLLVGAGLLIRSFQRLLLVDPGFEAKNLVTISTQVPASAAAPAQRAGIYAQIRERLSAVPGVVDVAAVSRLPLMGASLGSWIFIEGRYRPGEPGLEVEYRAATPNYFTVMRMPLRAGRYFDEHDNANPGSVLVINESAARKYWPGESAVGKRLKMGTPPERYPWVTIVGVVGDVRHAGIDIDPRPEVYRLYASNPLFSPILVIRTAVEPGPLISLLTARVRSVHAGLPTYNVFPMEALVDRSTAQRRFVMLLLTGFALAALLLAGVGIYGTVSQSVVHRTQEIGLRMALGASPSTALWLVFRQGLQLTVAGILAGSLLAAVLSRLMRKLLFEVRPLDPAAFGGAALILAAFAAFACYIPARRATSVDPMIALRRDG